MQPSTSLAHAVYGVNQRLNQANQAESQRDAEVPVSLFDEEAFKFYMAKYSGHFGIESLVSVLGNDIASPSSKISYHQKVKIVNFIIQTEQELDVCDSSWKHCLLHLLVNDVISVRQFNSMLGAPIIKL